MTIEEHIKQAMADCPLTEQQEDKLLIGLENYLNEIEQVKNLNIPAVSNNEVSVCVNCLKLQERIDKLEGDLYCMEHGSP